MADWVTISSLATAGGTLVLAVATFASVRSAKRSARITELALQEQLRPVLVHSNLDDPVQKIGFSDHHWVQVRGGGAAAEEESGNVYLVLSVRNVGTGIAVLQAWHPWADVKFGDYDHVPIADFRPLTRDLYIPAGGIGLWQGAIRDSSDEVYAGMSAACAERTPFAVDILYTDHMGGQRTISRFALIPTGDDDWVGTVSRHWNLDRAGPRGRDE
jgi:hypothetical protein